MELLIENNIFCRNRNKPKFTNSCHNPESVRPAPGSTSNPLTCMAI